MSSLAATMRRRDKRFGGEVRVGRAAARVHMPPIDACVFTRVHGRIERDHGQ
jgi:hypothetical protein